MELIHTPLNNIDIQNKVGCKFILYSDMDNVKNIEELLPCTLILYELAKVGHFTCIFENEEGINFFDPLGFAPDEELKNGAAAPDHDFTYLVRLLEYSSKPVIYNNHKLQSHGTSTCGHWCTIRMMAKKLYCDEFAKCFNRVKNKDLIVAKIFNDL